MNNRTEAKLTDLSGMQKAIKEILKQAWERGRKYEQAKERPQGDLISREALKKAFAEYGKKAKFTQGACQQLINNATTVEERMVYVQETVNTILNSCTGNTDIDKAFRNAARLVQNAIDGKSVDFEEIERSDEE